MYRALADISAVFIVQSFRHLSAGGKPESIYVASFPSINQSIIMLILIIFTRRLLRLSCSFCMFNCRYFQSLYYPLVLGGERKARASFVCNFTSASQDLSWLPFDNWPGSA